MKRYYFKIVNGNNGATVCANFERAESFANIAAHVEIGALRCEEITKAEYKALTAQGL